MAVSGLFLLGYGVFRFAVEFVRLPDAHIGYLAFGWLTMGMC
jgi:phosphatidylglycerol---prolipoprotein diacylglyceryl transferase